MSENKLKKAQAMAAVGLYQQSFPVIHLKVNGGDIIHGILNFEA